MSIHKHTDGSELFWMQCGCMNGNPRVAVKRSKFEKLVTNCSFILPICPNDDCGQLLKEFRPMKTFNS